MVQLSLTGLDYQKLLSWYAPGYGFHEERMACETLQKVFPLFQDCYKNI